MKKDKVLVVAIPEVMPRLISRITEQSRPNWQATFEFIELEKRTKYNTNASFTDGLIDRWNNGDFSRLIWHRQTVLDQERLKDQNIPQNLVSNADDLFNKINRELHQRRLHWLSYSKDEWSKSSLRFLNVEEWLSQFRALDCEWIGRNLLKQIRVVSDQELRNAFLGTRSEADGLRVCYAYVQDLDPGSSSLAVQSILQHLHGDANVIQLNLNDLGQGNLDKFDVLHVCEDGLWSGVELVRRLEKIYESKEKSFKRLQIHFKHGITCDAGLIAGRVHLRRKNINNIFLQPSPPEFHYSMIPEKAKDILNERLFSNDLSSDRALIDESVVPHAFQSTDIWGGRLNEAKEICTTLGSQLVPSFLARREFEKHEPSTAVTSLISDEKIKRWALGALNFGTVVTFSSSVPKPSLPLLWLKGVVEYNGKRIDWKPMFWDVRRIGSTPERRK